MLLQNILVLLLFTLYSVKSSLHVKHRREVKPKSMAETSPNAHIYCVSQKDDSIPLFRDLSMQSVKIPPPLSSEGVSEHRRKVSPKSMAETGHKAHIYYVLQKNDSIPLFRELQMQCKIFTLSRELQMQCNKVILSKELQMQCNKVTLSRELQMQHARFRHCLQLQYIILGPYLQMQCVRYSM